MAFWTEQRVNLLKKLWLTTEMSSTEIAERLGSGCTRNMVIGKRIRLGIADRGGSAGEAIKRRAIRKMVKSQQTTSQIRPHRGFVRLAPGTFKVEPFVPANDDVIVLFEERKTLQQLEKRDCRWPLGDPMTAEFRFCGREKVLGAPGPYCLDHLRVAYQMPRIEGQRGQIEPEGGGSTGDVKAPARDELDGVS
jgi:GcrA cell cycle regulator